MVARLKTILPEVIGPSQSAFFPGRQISDNKLLTQELMHNYHLNRAPTRCALKVDLRKAFNTISWPYILMGLKAIGISDRMSSRGIHQGDPLSPYLFVLAMEGLRGILSKSTMDPSFKFHWRCRQNKITHLSFADDLMIFCQAGLASVDIIRVAMDSFSKISGLAINHDKSYVFLSGVDPDLRIAITNQLSFKPGTLLVKYLGIPLISTRLTYHNCVALIDRITSRIKVWTSASLTYAGCLQLVKSTLFSIQVYWSSMLILPCATVKKIESILSAFLWKGMTLTHTRAKVAWTFLCYPLQEGGLGIKSIKIWNKAALLKHVWRLLLEGTSLWVIWVHSVLLKRRCFWDTFLWLDYWLPDNKRFCDLFPFRVLSSTGLPWDVKVSDIISDGRWAFPPGHPDLQPAIGLIISSNLVPRAYSSSSFYPLDSLNGATAHHGQAHLLHKNTYSLALFNLEWIASMGGFHTEEQQGILPYNSKTDEDISRLFPSSISGAQIPDLEQPVTNEEIKTALFSIPDDKAPGPDGFTSLFFKKSWSIIGADFMRAVSYFFEYSIMPRCINATRISLVPKVENPACMDDYRPISCCNVLYKCISKVLVARLKLILPDVISPSQSAFIPGRQISDNILLTQELLHNYHLNKGPARCPLKIDLKKAFDTISWQFILKGLQCIGIPVRMINWINACISSAFFSMGLNGSLHGFFPSSRGLRQGDPLPPYLFVIAMEGLGGILKGVAQVPGFQFHWRCKLNSITHLAFVDDLMVFCHADLASVELIRGALKSFSSISGLIINHNKSFVFISGVEDNIRGLGLRVRGSGSGFGVEGSGFGGKGVIWPLVDSKVNQTIGFSKVVVRETGEGKDGKGDSSKPYA
ncbi:hypothetical protein NC653_000125 [Populus alba x Populus x berolinensis]|uniref:Reverse transcriptase domain-containing protein n=1 Tax=Populus alba x Populus x berolinensis TaxID=444605 RepID=A0AAD6RHY1_9ROSI|nr:hypothetical protein NC653_000125 [Populus alba x Populus x berolinensis]